MRREDHITCAHSQGSYKLSYSDWGDKNAPVMMCVHGLTGNGRDFDFIAPALVERGYRVIAPDLFGRGKSDFLPNPLDYNHDRYDDDLSALLHHIGADKPQSVEWLGVSLGGLLGMRMAGRQKSPIKRLILNDIGPTVPKAALNFIHQVITPLYRFKNRAEFEQRLRETRGLSWGPLSDAQWAHMAEHNVRILEDGALSYAYDPAIAQIFEHQPVGTVDLWASWEKITAPILLIHGAQSPILTLEIIEEMKTRALKQDFTLLTFEDCGHVPSLMTKNQIEAIMDWLKYSHSH